MTSHRSACPLDCPDLCSLSVEVDDGRVVRIDADPRNPLTDGFICGKIRRFARHMYGEARIRTPGIRVGAKGDAAFREVTWDEALAHVADRLGDVRERFGGEAILPFSYGGSNGYLTQDTTDARLWRRLGTSRLRRTFCAAATGAAARGMYGGMPGVALEDYHLAKLIVVWGCNPSASGIHLVPQIRAAQKRGARLVVLDPRRTPLAKAADVHLAVRPGTDLAVALAMHGWLFDQGRADEAFLVEHATGVETLRAHAARWPLARAADVAGVAAADIERVVALYADTSPAVIRCGWGSERNRNGGSATAAILALPAVAGKFGVRAGGYTMSNGGAWSVRDDAAALAPEPSTREVNMNQLGHALTELGDPPIAALFVYNCNPAATAPNQRAVRRGLGREDLFTVVSEQVMTDTARFADVILPATTFLEHRELRRGYGAMQLFDSPAVATPVGLARANGRVFAELVERVGLAVPGDAVDEDAVAALLLDSSGEGDRIRAAISDAGVARARCGPGAVQMVDITPRTADKKIHLAFATAEDDAPRGLYAYAEDPGSSAFPLALISPALSRMTSSYFGQLHSARVPVEVHPDDATPRGIGSGDRVKLWNELGAVVCRARVTEDTRPGVLVLPKGLWSHHTESGTTANALCPESLADLGGGACFNDARVQLARADE